MQLSATAQKSDPETGNTSEMVRAAIENISNFSVIYDKYYVILYYFIFRRTSDRELTFDVTSTVFLKAMENLKNYKYTGVPFEAWLFRIALNEIYGMHRKKKIQLVYNLNLNDVQNLTTEVDAGEKEEMIVQVLSALELLEKEEMDMIEMRFFSKMSLRDIACILNITENYAGVKLFRIIQKLKEIITKKIKQ
jgi:RNA polymerase sigma-70 factor (ECF subfamily)